MNTLKTSLLALFILLYRIAVELAGYAIAKTHQTRFTVG